MFRIKCIITGKYAIELDLGDDWSFGNKDSSKEFETCLDAERFIEKHKLLNVEIV
jgi:hypothetical protein